MTQRLLIGFTQKKWISNPALEKFARNAVNRDNLQMLLRSVQMTL